MQKPTPPELRRAIIKYYEKHNCSQHEVAEFFEVSISTVKRILRRGRQGESLEPKRPTGGRKSSIQRSAERKLLCVINQNFAATLNELREIWMQETGQVISCPTWSRELTRLGYTKKKLRRRPQQAFCTAVAEQRVRFMDMMHRLPGKRLQFLDESGFYTDLGRPTGWAPRGKEPLVIGPIHRAKSFTVMGAVSVMGGVAMEKQTHAMKRVDFDRFIMDTLAPCLMTGDIVVMDRLPTHRSELSVQYLMRFGVQTLFLPPYSPDLNPIEKFWTMMKAEVRKINWLIAQGKLSSMPFEERLESAWAVCSTRDLRPLISWCGYRLT